jgi:phospholipase A1
MEQRIQHHLVSLFPAQVAGLAIASLAGLAALLCLSGTAQAQVTNATAQPGSSWQQCAQLATDKEARLACFDQWATQQVPTASPVATGAALASNQAMPAASPAPAVPPTPLAPVIITMQAPAPHDCRNPQFSELSRFWELEAGTDCGTFGIRGYRPISLAWIGSTSVNTAPSSPTAGHTATYQPYSTSEMRINLSVRTKIAQGLLTQGEPLRRDSLWFGYSQQSYWQLFNGTLSRPFRSTDHEPEITYIYPTDVPLPGDWRLRYSGASLVHQSNGQTLPLSRSWNRTILMAGMEHGSNLRVMGRVWQRIQETAADDDNPGIENYVGRAELAGYWDVNKDNTLGLTVRHSLRAQANGSVRLEWLKTLGDSNGNRSALRFHTQLFSGYGDSLVDYNRRRTVLSLGLSLVDW